MKKNTYNSIESLTKQGFLIDLHLHTLNSFDSEIGFSELIETAIERKIKILAVTDHYDLWAEVDNSDYKLIYSDAKKAADNCKDILILTGIEIGQGICEKSKYNEILSECDFDFILNSTHSLSDKKDFYYIDYDNCDVYLLLEKYFSAVLKSTNELDFDSLAHLTYPLRYINGNYKKGVSLERFHDIIDEIFISLIKNQRSLEVNTGGVRKAIHNISPEKELLERYFNMGGRLLTIGSDAHFKEHLGADIKDTLFLLKEIGFKEICFYKKRQKYFIEI